MANMIFDERDDAINEHRDSNIDLVVVNDDNVMEPNPSIVIDELNQQMNGITAALEDIGTLNKIKERLANSPKSKSSIKIGQLAMENVKKRLNVFELTGVSTEAADNTGKDELTVAIEGISEFITKIFKMIANTIRAIVETIKKAFNYLLGKKKEEKFQSLIDDIEKAAKSQSHILVDKNQLSNTLPRLSKLHRNFKHYNDDLTSEKLHKGLDLLTNGIVNVGNLIIPFAECIEVGCKAIMDVNNDNANQNDSVEKINQSIHKKCNRVEEVLPIDSDLRSYVKRYTTDPTVSEIGYDFRPLGLFHNNEMFFYYKVKVKENSSLSEDMKFNSIIMDELEATVVPLDLNHLLSYVKRIEKTTETLERAADLFEKEFQPISNLQIKTANLLNNIIVLEDTESALAHFLNNNRPLLNNLLQSGVQLVKAMISADKAIDDHIRLAVDLFKLYKPKQ